MILLLLFFIYFFVVEILDLWNKIVRATGDLKTVNQSNHALAIQTSEKKKKKKEFCGIIPQ